MHPPLIIQHRAPYADHAASEALDLLLVLAAFGQNPAVLFSGDGVWQLLANQHPAALGHKSLAAQLQSLPLYDVEHLYADADSLRARGLQAEQLALPVQWVEAEDMAALLARHHPLLRI